MKPTYTLFYKGSPINDEDTTEIARDFKISYALAAEAIDQLRHKGQIVLAQYAGTPRERLRLLCEAVSTTPVAVAGDGGVAEASGDGGEPLPDEAGDAETTAEASQTAQEPPQEESGHIVPESTQSAPEIILEQESTDPLERTELDEIVDHAASSLMTSFSDPEGCFLINPDGCCEINPSNPPTVEQGLQAVRHILKLKELGSVVEDKSSWMLGSAVVALENFHGENVFCISQVCDETTKAYNTIYQASAVFKAFPKRYKLPYSSHQEVHFAKIPGTPEEQMEAKKLILHKSELYGLGGKQTRSLCSIAKKMDGDTTTIRNIRSKQQAEALIEAYRDSKVTYLVYEDGEMRKINGSAGDPPKGKLVINLKDWNYSVNGDKPVDIITT